MCTDFDACERESASVRVSASGCFVVHQNVQKTNYNKNEAVKLLSIILFFIFSTSFLRTGSWNIDSSYCKGEYEKFNLYFIYTQELENKTESVQIPDALMALNKKGGEFTT